MFKGQTFGIACHDLCMARTVERRGFVAALSLLAFLGLVSCGDKPDGNDQEKLGYVEQFVSFELLQQRSDAVKAVNAAHSTIHNPLMFAGIAYAETQMAHCYSEYYNQVSSYVCPGPTSSDCGGAVTAGYWDGACSLQAGGLGMWQFDEGNYSQTLSKWTTSGYWNGQTHDILDVEGSIYAAIDFILFKAWYSSYTPYFSSYQAMYDWINGIRPVNGDTNYELWLGFLANSYNGQPWGSSDWATIKERYRSATSYLYSALGGDGYWYSSSPPVPACGVGLYCALNSIPGSSACMSGSTLVYCCPSGQTIVNGACSGSSVPPCGVGLYCALNSITGSSACMSGSTLVYCCPLGQTIVNGACSG